MLGRPSRLWLSGLPAALALLVLAKPYEGLERDDVLYFGQVLRASRLPGLSADPFFAGGSQSDFSVYAHLVAPLYTLLGAATVNAALVLLCWVALLAGSLAILRRAELPTALQVAGLCSIAVLCPFYGGMRMFAIAEPFLTARSLAEPLVLWGLAAAMWGYPRLGLVLQGLAATVHPLVALPALAATWAAAVWHDRRWLWFLALLPIVAGLALAGIEPAALLFKRYDTYWWGLVSSSNVQVVLSNWRPIDWANAATDTALLWSASRWIGQPSLTLLMRAVLAVAIALLAINALGTDLLQAVLITQLQLWRGLWLVHLFAMLFAPFVLWRSWQYGGFWRVSAALAALALASNLAGSNYGGIFIAGWGLSAWVAMRGWPISASLTRLSLVACGLAILGMSGIHLALLIERLHWHPPISLAVAVVACTLTEPAVVFLAAWALAWLGQGQTALQRVYPAAIIALLLFGLAHWDRRTELAVAVEAAPKPHPFKPLIPTNATVYWPDQLAAVWGLLERVSHYNRQQGAGMLFNRATAGIIGPRREAYDPLIKERDSCQIAVALSRSTTATDLAACNTPSPARVRELCAGPIHPDYVVFNRGLPLPPLATWDVGADRFRLYACSQFATASQT